MDSQYFAAKPVPEIASELSKRVDRYYEALRATGKMRLWRRVYNQYYKATEHGGALQSEGEQGELTRICVNHFRNLLQHILVMTTAQRPAFEPRATNSDYESQAQTILAAGLLDFYMRDKRLERVTYEAVKSAVLFDQGFVTWAWDAQAGKEYSSDPATGEKKKEGDIIYKPKTPLDVIRDLSRYEPDGDNWVIFRSFRNRYDLMARYPEMAEQIKAVSAERDDLKAMRFNPRPYPDKDTDEIAYFEFYHDRTDAMPDGRATVFLDDKTVLMDSLSAGAPMPYRKLPFARIAPENQTHSTNGYTVAYDLLQPQQALDALYSTITSNQSTFGVQNVLTQTGSNISVTQMSGGLNIIECDLIKGAEPRALNLTSTPPEIFNFAEGLEHSMETISGVNSVARGNPEANLKSGTALALIQSMAIQFSTGLQESYVQLLEDLGSATIELLQDYATVPRVAMIAGKSNRPLMRTFTGGDLSKINRVTVDVGSPMARTTAGRGAIAEQLLAANMIADPDQYLQVLNTGRLEPAIEGKTAELLNIKAENEALADGKPAKAVITDNHPQHVLEHKTVLASPEARENPAIVQAALDHIQEHIGLFESMPPPMAMMLGLPPPPPPPGPPGMPPGVPPMEGSNLPSGGDMTGSNLPPGPPPPGVSAELNPAGAEAPPPRMPGLPPNPMTGEPAAMPS